MNQDAKDRRRSRRHSLAGGVCVLMVLLACAVPSLAQPPKLPQDVELTNPGFEEGKKGWSDSAFTKWPKLVALDNQVAHGGHASLRISSERGSENPFVGTGAKDLQGSATYAFRTWAKCDPTVRGNVAAVKIEYYNAAGQNTSGYYTRLSLPTDGQWVPLEVRAKADPDTVRASLLLRLFGVGRVWFDDVQCQMVALAPKVTLSPERQVIPAGKDREIPLTVRLAKPVEGDGLPALKFTVLTPPDGTPYQPEAALKRVDGRTFEAVAKMPTMVSGAYQVECALGEDRGSVRVFVPVEKRQPRFLTDTGTILVDGKPFFPIGIYHVGTSQYPELARRGFNCVQGVSSMDLEIFGKGLDAAQKSRIMMDVPLYAGGQVARNLQGSLRKLNQYRRHAAVLNWKIIDEPEIRPEIMDEVPGVYQTLKSVDPDHPLLLTLCQPDQYSYWVSFADIVQVDPYPIPSKPLTLVSDCVAGVKKHMAPWQNLTAVLQAGWIADPSNQPSYAQARVMLYLALVKGAKGIFWYSYSDPGWDLSKTALWDRFADLNAETAQLATPIMEGREVPGVKVETSKPGVQWLARELADRVYVLLVNPTDKSISVTVDPGRSMGCGPCLKGKPPVVKEGKATVEIPSLGADTVIFTTPPPGQ